MSQKYDEYLEKHRQAVKKAYQWIAAYIPELTDVEATRNIEFHDMSKNTPDEYTPYDNYFYREQTPAIIEAFNRAWLMHILNLNRDSFNKNAYDDPKIPWWQMIQLLPSSYNQRRTVMLNYEVLANIYKSRRNHKLDEWHTLCDWIERLPYSELITGKEEKADV